MDPVFDGGYLSDFFAGSIYLRDKSAVIWKVGRSFKNDHRAVPAFEPESIQYFSHLDLLLFTQASRPSAFRQGERCQYRRMEYCPRVR